jgi:hypothetical protein
MMERRELSPLPLRDWHPEVPLVISQKRLGVQVSERHLKRPRGNFITLYEEQYILTRWTFEVSLFQIFQSTQKLRSRMNHTLSF